MKTIFFNGDTIRDFYFTKVKDDEFNEVSYFIFWKGGFLTNMIPRDEGWMIEDKQSSPLYCNFLEKEFEKAILDYESLSVVQENS